MLGSNTTCMDHGGCVGILLPHPSLRVATLTYIYSTGVLPIFDLYKNGIIQYASCVLFP